MPNILILGCSGLIAFPLAQSLLRSGNHTIYGLVRKPHQVSLLQQNEIFPILGDAGDKALLEETIKEKRIDVVVDAASAYEHAGGILDVVKAASEAMKQDAGDWTCPKLGFVYVSGTWVHGSPAQRTSDRTLVGHASNPSTPASATSWRPAHEQRILASRDVLDVAIIRPSQVYGKGGWIWETWWSPLLAARGQIEQGSKEKVKVQVPVGREARTAVIHVDDVVSALHAVVDRIEGRLGNWPVFDLVSETVGIGETLDAVARVMKIENEVEIEFTGTGENVFFQAMGVRSNLDGTRANTVLGWTPKRREFLLGMDKYVMAWEAAMEEKKREGK